MPTVLIESVSASPSPSLGFLPMDGDGIFGRRGILRPTMFDTPEESPILRALSPILRAPTPAPVSTMTPARPLPLPMPGNTGPVPPFGPWGRGLFPPWRWRGPNGQPNWNTGIVPPGMGTRSIPLPPSPVVVVDHANPGAPESSSIGAPAPVQTPGNTGPLPPAPVMIQDPVIGAPAPPPVSAATASMYATPTGSSMFATPGAPSNNSMFATVQGSGSQVARISGANALSGLPTAPGSGKTIALVVLAGLAALTIWGSHLNKAAAPRRRAAR